MAETIYNCVSSYLKNLSATNTIRTSFGATLVEGTNLFIYYGVDKSYNTISLLPYPGEPPGTDNQKQSSYVQINVRATSKKVAMETSQALINNLHMNTLKGSGKMFALNSNPYIFSAEDQGEYVNSTSNFKIKHIKK